MKYVTAAAAAMLMDIVQACPLLSERETDAAPRLLLCNCHGPVMAASRESFSWPVGRSLEDKIISSSSEM